VDNASGISERLKDSGFIRLVHPPCSPDRAPCSVFLFGSLQKQLKQSGYGTPDELEDAIVRTRQAIPRETLLDIFARRRKRLETDIEKDRDYFERTLSEYPERLAIEQREVD
jgi:hypothetical protein